MIPLPRLAFALLLWLPLIASAAPRAWLDRDSIRMGETVTLNVETDARGGSEPDFSVLDANFRRLGTSSSTELSVVNGRQSARALWAVALEPRQEGVVGIPALQVGNEQTQPLSLTVLPLPAGGSAAAGDDVFLEIEAQPASPYVQQQVQYVVRLYYAVSLLEGQLEEPQVTGAQVRRLGQDVQFQKTLAERRYNVVERRYALLPESSGRLEIPGPQFRGRALRTGGYGSLMSPNANLSARGNAIQLDVRARPPKSATPWLPAQAVELVDETGVVPDELTVGEPLTLTLRLTAQGLSAEQLPELAMPAIDGAEVYPDQESSQTRDDGRWLRGERVRKFAVVPTRSGTLQLPEIAVDWWDVMNDRAARAVLAPRAWRVTGAAAAAAVPADSSVVAADAGDGAATAVPGAVTGTADLWTHRAWPLATLVFAGLWIASLIVLRRRRAAAALPAADATPVRGVPDAWRVAWPRAIGRQDLGAAARALIEAARERGTATTLEDVAQALDEATQRDAVRQLEQALYRGQDSPGLLAALRGAFARGPRWRAPSTRSAKRDDTALPPLYPPH